MYSRAGAIAIARFRAAPCRLPPPLTLAEFFWPATNLYLDHGKEETPQVADIPRLTGGSGRLRALELGLAQAARL
jgi:hypothetical protein